MPRTAPVASSVAIAVGSTLKRPRASVSAELSAGCRRSLLAWGARLATRLSPLDQVCDRASRSGPTTNRDSDRSPAPCRSPGRQAAPPRRRTTDRLVKRPVPPHMTENGAFGEAGPPVGRASGTVLDLVAIAVGRWARSRRTIRTFSSGWNDHQPGVTCEERSPTSGGQLRADASAGPLSSPTAIAADDATAATRRGGPDGSRCFREPPARCPC